MFHGGETNREERGSVEQAQSGTLQERRHLNTKASFTIEQLITLCAIGVTQKEAAAVFGVTDETICNRLKEWGESTWEEFAQEHKAVTRASLRREQVKKAMEGDTKMLIHLGKAWLGQTNAVERAHAFKAKNVTVRITDNEEEG